MPGKDDVSSQEANVTYEEKMEEEKGNIKALKKND